MKRIAHLFCVLTTGGCGVVDDITGAGGKADEINPTDNETLGTLAIHYPSMMPDNPFSIWMTFNGEEVAIGDNRRLEFNGTHELLLEGDPYIAGGADHYDQTTMATVTPGHTTTVTLAAYSVRWSTASLAVDFGTPVVLHGTDAGRSMFDPQDQDITGLTGAESRPIVTLPGTFTLDLGKPILGNQSFTVTSGQFKRVEITPPDKRATLRVHAPQRKFLWPSTQCSLSHHYLVQRSSDAASFDTREPLWNNVAAGMTASPSRNIDLFKGIDLAEDASFRMLPFTAAEAPMHYEYVVNQESTTVALTPGQTTDVYVKRIDVNDVLVTRENGTTYYASGIYTIAREVSSGVWKNMALTAGSGCNTTLTEFSTKTGIDVLPGRYKVTIRYSTEEGMKTQTFTLTL